MQSDINKVLARILRAVAGQLDAGTCDFSEERTADILDAITGSHSTGAQRDRLIESLGRAYEYLSERQDALEAKIRHFEHSIGNEIRPNFKHENNAKSR